MSFQINNAEVLKHLNNYGITSVDDESLKLFIKDLKKLIKYELRKNSMNSNTKNDNPPPSQKLNPTVPTELSSMRQRGCIKKKIIPNICPVPCCKCEPVNCCGNVLYCNCHSEKLSPAVNRKNTYFRENMKDSDLVCKCKSTEEKSDVSKICSELPPKKNETVDQNNRPTSSTSYSHSHSGGRSKKLTRDPVELYQYYQSIWKQHTLPGENDHAQLRRSIRERLMKIK